jgi:hypothetical protein
MQEDMNTYSTIQDDTNIMAEHIVSPITVTACVPGKRGSINMLQDISDISPVQQPIHPAAVRNNICKKSKKSNKNTRTPSTYQLGYFALWWGRMEREGNKEAERRKCEAEDQAASRGMRMFLGCGRKKEDGLRISEEYAKKTSLGTLDVDDVGDVKEMITGRTLETASYKTVKKDIRGTGGGKRLLEGGLDSPSKRARKFEDLKYFWGGRGEVSATFKHTPTHTRGTYRRLSSASNSDNNPAELGQTKG